MSSTNFKRTVLATSVAVSLLGMASTAAVAEQNNAQDESLEVIAVKGIKGSLKANINAKRYADSVVDVITAEDIGKFPDKNVADSLSRITGVGISREFGEGEKITIRGSGPTVNRTLLNGQNVGTADWFILDTPSRSFNFTLLPSSLVKSLEVHKSAQAKIDEGSIGGTVVVNTRRPLELDANTLKLGVQSQYSETSGKNDPQLDGLYSWKNDNESFGALLSFTKQDRTVQREGLEILGWTENAATGQMAPKDIGNPMFKQDRERETVFASFQYAPSSELDMTLNILDTRLDMNNANANLLIRPQNDLADLTSVQADGNDIYAASVASGGSYEWDFINRESSTETSSYDLDINYQAQGYKVHAQVGKTEAKGGTYNETSWSFVPNIDGGYSFDLSGQPEVNIDVDPTNGSLWSQNWTWGGNKPTTDDETFAQLDFTFDVEYGPFETVEVGVKYRDHDRSQGRQAYSWHGPNTGSTADTAYMWEIFEQCPTLDTCGQSVGVHDVAGNVVNGNVVTQLQGDRERFMELGFGGNADYAVSNVLSEIWEINEKITALYAQGNFSGEDYRGNLGLRVVKTTQSSSSFNFSQDSWGFHTVDREWLTPSTLDWVTEERDYTEVFPSFNLAINATEDQVIRVGAARVMARPNFADLAPMLSTGDLNGDKPTGQSGNPNLKPLIADQFDVTWEYYFNESSLLSLVYFYKDIQGYRDTQFRTEQKFNEQTQQWVDVEINSPVNGLGGATNGLEIGYQQTFNDYGLAANYTYTDAEREGEFVYVEGASKHMFNAQAFYETDEFGARLMYNYRSEWYKGPHWTGAELWNDSYGQWDFSASYNFSDDTNLVLEVVNITDEKVIEFDAVPSRLISSYQNGRRVVLGVNMSF